MAGRARKGVAVGVLAGRQSLVAFLELAVMDTAVPRGGVLVTVVVSDVGVDATVRAKRDTPGIEKRAAVRCIVPEVLIQQNVGGPLALEPRVVAFAVVRPVARVVAEIGLRVQLPGDAREAHGKRKGDHIERSQVSSGGGAGKIVPRRCRVRSTRSSTFQCG